MPEQRVFLPLLQHEYMWRHERQHYREGRNKWWFVYAIPLTLLWLPLWTYLINTGSVKLHNVWYFTLGFPYMAFFISYGNVIREWKNGTRDWWLALPHSRLHLVAAKYVASLLQAFLITVVSFAVASILGAYTAVTSDVVDADTLIRFLLTGASWSVILIALYPLLIALGMFIGIVGRSRVKPLTPLLWILFFLAASGLYTYFGSADDTHNLFLLFSGAESVTTSFPYPPGLPFVVTASWIAAYCLVRATARVLERHLDI